MSSKPDGRAPARRGRSPPTHQYISHPLNHLHISGAGIPKSPCYGVSRVGLPACPFSGERTFRRRMPSLDPIQLAAHRVTQDAKPPLILRHKISTTPRNRKKLDQFYRTKFSRSILQVCVTPCATTAPAPPPAAPIRHRLRVLENVLSAPTQRECTANMRHQMPLGGIPSGDAPNLVPLRPAALSMGTLTSAAGGCNVPLDRSSGTSFY